MAKNGYTLDWSPLERDAPPWFRDGKFGLFFHWGPYSVPACENEWYSRNMYGKGLSQNRYHRENYGSLDLFGYKDFFPLFRGEKFDPPSWADLTRRAGARYGGPVTEHADNFSLWDSRVNPVNSVNYGPRRDVVGESARAFRDRGLRFAATFHHQWLWGWFMSSDPEADVYDPANEVFYGKALPLETCRYLPYRFPDGEFCRTWADKVKEVVDLYEPDLVYFDSRTLIIEEAVRREVMEHCYREPGGSERVITFKQEDFPSGTGILDIECGRLSGLHDRAWQTDDRLEDMVTWCHVRGVRYKTARRIIHQLADVVSKNGNLLLNVGPRADGSFTEESLAVLEGIGDWLERYGECIYGTRPFAVFGEGKTCSGERGFDIGQIEAQTRTGIIETREEEALRPGDLRFTTKGDILYVILPFPPVGEPLAIETLSAGGKYGKIRILGIDVVGGEEGIPFKKEKDALRLPHTPPWPDGETAVLRIRTAGLGSL